MPPTYRDVRRTLRAAGWIRARQRGSHEIWVSPDGGSSATVAGKDSTTVLWTLTAIRRQTGLEDLR